MSQAFRTIAFAGVALAALCLSPLEARAEDAIVVASTTSLQDSGLYDYLLPIFTRKTGIIVKVVARGTGQALDTGRRGDADVVFVHAESQELQFIADGDGVKRYPVMYDDFVLIGPAGDPAHILGGTDIVKAFQAVAAAHAVFISRGDRSGTHIAELGFWKDAGIDVDAAKGSWYRPIGQGMGAALNVASASDAYVLSDRPSWLNFGNKGNLRILVQGDPRLFNQYSVILVNPKTHPQVKQEQGMRFIEYLVSPQGQSAIAQYKINEQQAFHPNADGVFP
jgi:tungstate transport system substrate-binding protein